jgi:biotin synthase
MFTLKDVRDLYDLPLTQLVFRAQSVHREHQQPDAVQLCTLLSIKTGGCPEDCGYCPQSARHKERMPVEPLMGEQFHRVLRMVRGVRDLGMEACVTLGMLNDEQAKALAEAGLTAYNHNLDTSREFYGKVITTRGYDERLQTLEHVHNNGIHVCCGGIIGMGESIDDRCRMLAQLASMPKPPESVPINALVAVPGTPLENQPPVDSFELVRMCAVARILMPKARVRLSAGRSALSREAQMLCFLAGANSIFYGDKLLTTSNPEADADLKLLKDAGMSTIAAEPAPARGDCSRASDDCASSTHSANV